MQVEVAKVRVKLNILRNDMEEAVQGKDFLRAQELKEKMDKLEEVHNRLEEKLTEAAAMAARPAIRSDTAKEKKASQEESLKETSNIQMQKNESPEVVHKCLEILYHLMQDTKIKTLDNTLRTFLDELVMPAIRNLQPEIRMAAIRALGILSLRCIEVAKQNIVLLFQVHSLQYVQSGLA